MADATPHLLIVEARFYEGLSEALLDGARAALTEAQRGLQKARLGIQLDVRAAWLALEDTHDFFPLLRRYGVSRRQALRLAPPGHARPVPASALASALANAAATDLPIMVFVGSPGCIEIHSGPIARVKRLGCWLNVLDPGFNLHLREDHVAEAFVVRKPTRDGEVTSLELVDAQGDTIAMLFGKRKPGLAEDPRWRALARGLL